MLCRTLMVLWSHRSMGSSGLLGWPWSLSHDLPFISYRWSSADIICPDSCRIVSYLLLLSESREENKFLDKAKTTLVPLIRIHRQDKGVLNTGFRALQKVCVPAALLWVLMVQWTQVCRRNSGHTEAADSKANPHLALLDMRLDRTNVTVMVIILGDDGQWAGNASMQPKVGQTENWKSWIVALSQSDYPTFPILKLQFAGCYVPDRTDECSKLHWTETPWAGQLKANIGSSCLRWPILDAFQLKLIQSFNITLIQTSSMQSSLSFTVFASSPNPRSNG